jgi:hypothetical protein
LLISSYLAVTVSLSKLLSTYCIAGRASRCLLTEVSILFITQRCSTVSTSRYSNLWPLDIVSAHIVSISDMYVRGSKKLYDTWNYFLFDRLEQQEERAGWWRSALILWFTDLMCTKYKNRCRFQWLRGLRRGSAAARWLGLWFRIPPGHEFLSVVIVSCCQVKFSARSWSLVQRSPTDCGASLRSV